MNRLLLLLGAVTFAGCVGPPPTPCTQCGSVCVDTKTDSANCGTCGTACAAGKICTGGACKDNCPSGEKACGGKCVDTVNDPLNCGTCGTNCGAGMLCVASACATSCPPTQDVCAGKCTDRQTDSANCGMCGMACGATKACVGGTCTDSCPGTQAVCGGKCVDRQVDSTNCGACGMACGSGALCVAGTCTPTCAPPLGVCSGACVNVMTDVAHCGMCGAACTPQNVTAPLCTAGSCGYAACAPGFTDCDGDPKNGCEVATNQCIVLISVALDGGAGNGPSYAPAADRSGTKVIFLSEASDLIPNDTNGIVDVFVRDVAAKSTTRVSTLWDGGEVPGDAGAGYVSVDISADGKTLALSTNMPMINPDTNGTGTDAIVIAADGGRSYGALSSAPGNQQPGGNTNSFGPLFLSEDGNLVTYMTRSNTLLLDGMGLAAPGESNVFQYDRTARLVTCASFTFNNLFVNGGALGFNAFPSWSTRNGRYITYVTFGNQVVPGPNDACSHAYLRDQLTGTNTRLSVLDNGATMTCGFQQGVMGSPSVSGDGLTAAFNTRTQLPGGPFGALENVYVRDLRTRKSTLVSIGVDGGPANAASFAQPLSDDGKWLGLVSDATNLYPNDTNGQRDCFWYDVAGQKLTRANTPVVASPDGGSGCVGLRLNGPATHAVLETRDGLSPNDTNNATDVYLRRVR